WFYSFHPDQQTNGRNLSWLILLIAFQIRSYFPLFDYFLRKLIFFCKFIAAIKGMCFVSIVANFGKIAGERSGITVSERHTLTLRCINGLYKPVPVGMVRKNEAPIRSSSPLSTSERHPARAIS